MPFDKAIIRNQMNGAVICEWPLMSNTYIKAIKVRNYILTELLKLVSKKYYLIWFKRFISLENMCMCSGRSLYADIFVFWKKELSVLQVQSVRDQSQIKGLVILHSFTVNKIPLLFNYSVKLIIIVIFEFI